MSAMSQHYWFLSTNISLNFLDDNTVTPDNDDTPPDHQSTHGPRFIPRSQYCFLFTDEINIVAADVNFKYSQ